MEDINRQNFQDRALICLDCGAEFVFSAGEQRFFWSKGLAEPKRCPACRELRKRTIIPREVRDD